MTGDRPRREHRTGPCDSAAASPGERATDPQGLCPPPGEVAPGGQPPGRARRSAGRVTWPGNAEDPEVLSCPHGRFPAGDVELVLGPADPGARGIAGGGHDRRDLGRRLPVSEAREHLDVAAVECRRPVRTCGIPGGRPVHGFLLAATEQWTGRDQRAPRRSTRPGRSRAATVWTATDRPVTRTSA